MNRIYRKVWNKALGQLVVASELASSNSAGVVMDERHSAGLRLQALSVAVALGLGASAWVTAAQAHQY